MIDLGALGGRYSMGSSSPKNYLYNPYTNHNSILSWGSNSGAKDDLNIRIGHYDE